VVEGARGSPNQMSITPRRVASIVWDFLRMSVTCGTIGAGIGFLQGFIVSRQASRDERMDFAGVASISGAAIAMIAGTIIYFVIKGEVSLKQFSTTVFWVISVGTLVAFFSRNELITVFADILVVIVVTIYQS
jgi:energy-converting hydrogenase Eha subunit G